MGVKMGVENAKKYPLATRLLSKRADEEARAP